MKYFIYVAALETDVENSLVEFSELHEAKSWILKNYKKENKMRLFSAQELDFKYTEEIEILPSKKEV